MQMRNANRTFSKGYADEFSRDGLALGIFVLNANGTIRYCNEVLLRRIGATLAQSCGQSVVKFIPDFPLAVDVPDLAAVLAATAHEPKLMRLQPLSGDVAVVRLTARPLLPKGRSSLVVVIEDIESQPLASGERDILNLMISSETSVEAVAITDCRGDIKFVNQAFEYMTGYRRAELIGQSLQRMRLGPPDLDRNPKFWREVQAGNSFSNVCLHCRKDGTPFHHEQKVRPFFAKGGAVTHVVFTGRDVSQRVLAAQQLNHQANYDSLTELPNRNLLSDRLQQVLKHATRCREGFAVAMLDVDKFKAINDGYGHAVGDAVLCKVARRVEASVRAVDTLGRLGGDEFILIFPGIGKREDAEDVIEKIRAAFLTDFTVEGEKIKVALSVGVAVYPLDGEDLQTLLKFADKEMYRDKEEGIGRRVTGSQS